MFEFTGADDVKLEHLVIRGAYYGVSAVTASDSDRISISNSLIQNNSNAGVYIEAGNENFSITGSRIEINGGTGVAVGSADAVIDGNEFVRNGQGGVATSGVGSVITGNRAWGNGGWGINASGGVVGNVVRAENNDVFDNAYGLTVSGAGTVALGNRLWGNTNNGLDINGGALGENNDAWGNGTGISVNNATARNNRSFGTASGPSGATSSQKSFARSASR